MVLGKHVFLEKTQSKMVINVMTQMPSYNADNVISSINYTSEDYITRHL